MSSICRLNQQETRRGHRPCEGFTALGSFKRKDFLFRCLNQVPLSGSLLFFKSTALAGGGGLLRKRKRLTRVRAPFDRLRMVGSKLCIAQGREGKLLCLIWCLMVRSIMSSNLKSVPKNNCNLDFFFIDINAALLFNCNQCWEMWLLPLSYLSFVGFFWFVCFSAIFCKVKLSLSVFLKICV